MAIVDIGFWKASDSSAAEAELAPLEQNCTLRNFISIQNFMDNDRISLELRSWNRFRSPGLVVKADLLGATHTFDFAGRSCTVTLPPTSEALKSDSERGRLYCYTEDGDGKKAISYEIHSVDLSVNVLSPISLPKSVLAHSPNAYDLLQKQEQTALGVLAKDCHDLALHSYDLWLRTMRWRTQ